MLRMILKFDNTVIKEITSDKEEITIGRSDASDVQIDNMAVSGTHARMLKETDHYVLEDLKSTNGTFVNEENVNRCALKENDVITIGKHSLTVSYKKAGTNIADLEKTYDYQKEHLY